MKRLAPLAAALALISVTPVAAAQAPGSPDRGFGRAGTVAISDPFLELTPELVAHRRGRILVGARAHVPGGVAGPGFSFFRLLRDGRLDRRFGRRGRVDADLPGASVGALLPNGGFAAARIREGAFVRGMLEVVRLTRSGARDTTFGDGGLATVHVPAVTGPVALEPQAGGGLLVAMTSASSPGTSVTVLRLDRAGRVDPSFGSGGELRLRSDEFVGGADLAVRPDGRMIVALVVYERVAATHRLMLAAFDAAGRPDPSFGTDGSGVVAEPSGPARPAEIALGPGGRLGVAGSSAFVRGDFAAWAYEPDGTRSIFRTVKTRTGAENGTAVAFDRAGRMLLAGHLGGFVEHRGLAVARLGRAGRPDRRFGRRGVVLRPLPTPSAAEAIAAQPDGRVLVAGWQLRGRDTRRGDFRRTGPGVIRLLRLNG
ncbi:MAG TPA: hypothetical protein VGW14_07015 [Thermoleophilaceae bacterium]|nr:hypothetical protein [Thermoleophilaceae bacterium]